MESTHSLIEFLGQYKPPVSLITVWAVFPTEPCVLNRTCMVPVILFEVHARDLTHLKHVTTVLIARAPSCT